MKTFKNICFVLVLFTTKNCLGQLCNGSLGDPVVNITFGSGSGIGNPLKAAATSYYFTTSSCPNDGFYTVVNSSSGCFNGTWHTLSRDHTGDANGYFMLVNASYQPGDFYVDTVRGLCANTTFEFAAWIVNVLNSRACNGNGIKPNLTLYIETTAGVRLDSLTTGDIYIDNVPTWKQYGFYFKTPPNVNDVVVRIRNNAPGGCGNDLALDDITFKPCGPLVSASITGSGDTAAVCDDDSKIYTLQAHVSEGYSNPSYQWQTSNDNINWNDITGATTTTYKRKPTGIGTYYYRIAVAESGNINSPNCRIVSNTIKFKVEGKPVTNATSNSPVCEGTTLLLTASGGTSYQWKGPNNFAASGTSVSNDFTTTIPDVGLAEAGKYYVTVSTNAGCSQQDSTIVSIKAKPIAEAGSDTGICEGKSVTLNASGGDTYSWQPASGLSNTNVFNPTASPADTIAYIVTVTNNNSGCSDDDTVLVKVYHKPTVSAGADISIIEGDKTILNGNTSGSVAGYFWTPDTYINSANKLQPTVNPPTDITYTLHVQAPAGCGETTDDVFVKVYKKVLVPNAFSPNKDGINDTWQLTAIDAYPNAEVSVFNRYGKAVFTSHGYGKPWNGTYNGSPLPVGTYYYVIDLKVALPLLKGWVMILR